MRSASRSATENGAPLRINDGDEWIMLSSCSVNPVYDMLSTVNNGPVLTVYFSFAVCGRDMESWRVVVFLPL